MDYGNKLCYYCIETKLGTPFCTICESRIGWKLYWEFLKLNGIKEISNSTISTHISKLEQSKIFFFVRLVVEIFNQKKKKKKNIFF